MNILSQDSQFFINLPRGFFPEEIEEKYSSLLENMKNDKVFPSIDFYFNHNIRSVDFPGYNLEVGEQVERLGKTRKYLNVTHEQMAIGDRKIEIKFKDVDSHALYFIMRDVIMYHHSRNSIHNQYLDPIDLRILDLEGDVVFMVKFHKVMMTKHSNKTFDFASPDVKDNSFSVTFDYNEIDISYALTLPEQSVEDVLISSTILNTYG